MAIRGMKGGRAIGVSLIVLILSTEASAFIGGIYVLIKDLVHGLVEAIAQIIGKIFRDFMYTVIFIKPALFNKIDEALQPDVFLNILQHNPELILASGAANPVIAGKVNFFIKFLAPFYLLAFLSLGVYLLLVSSSPGGRAKAKGSLLRLIISVAFVFLTIPIVQALLDLSAYFTKVIISYNSGNMETALTILRNTMGHFWMIIATRMPFAFWLLMPLLLLMIFIPSFPFIVIGMRYFMILVFTMIFPFGIFFYSLHFTRGLGKSIIRNTALWIFIQPLMAILLAVIGIASIPLLNLVSGSSIEIGLGLAGFFVLSAAPLMMVGVMNWVEILAITFASVEAPVMDIAMMEEEEMEMEG